MPYNMDGYNNNRMGSNGSNPRTFQFKPSDSTNGPFMVNEHQGKFLQFDYWNNLAQLTIGAVPPGMEIDFNARRNANTTKVNINFGDLSELLDVIDEAIESIGNAGTFTSTAIKTGGRKDSIVEISNGSNLGQPNGIYLVLHKGIDTTNRSAAMEFYPFATTTVMRNYDRSSGQFKEEPTKLGQFKRFRHLVEQACHAFTLAQAHAIKNEDVPKKMLQFRALAACTAALGVDMSAELTSVYGNRGGAGGGDYNNNRANGMNTAYGKGGFGSAPGYMGNGAGAIPANATTNQILATMDDPVDINLSMNDLASVNLPQFK